MLDFHGNLDSITELAVLYMLYFYLKNTLKISLGYFKLFIARSFGCMPYGSIIAMAMSVKPNTSVNIPRYLTFICRKAFIALVMPVKA